ncbi:MAG: hypothetical protein IT395_05180 [Candidatus Omnitrophica bacterium]|nr:hypothetical protein [Candidatus Omnitrophota bacterium]
MNKLSLTTLLLAFAIAAPVCAQQSLQIIKLKDGTTIKGQLVNVANGSYTIASSTMGQVKVSADQILSINSAEAVSGGGIQVGADGKISADTINDVKTNMMQDPAIMSLIQELVKDPEIAELMKNPSLMQDALSMDPQKIQNNPEVQKLMQNPTMQEIIRVTAGRMQNSAK